MKIKVSDYVAKFLQIQGTSNVFEVAGGMIAHFLDSFYRLKTTSIISVHHEQAAAFAVDAYGRLEGRPSVALATSGPGATNLLTGIGNCYFDSSPALFITGQVNTYEKKRNLDIRQLGFQETDIVSMAKPITKKCFEVENAKDIAMTLKQAYEMTMTGRPGPVLIDIPMDIQRAIINVEEPTKILIKPPPMTSVAKKNTGLLIECLKNSKKPLLLVGRGIRAAQAKEKFEELLNLFKVPVATTLLGLDVISYSNQYRVGFIGSYGNRWANIALGNADVLVVLGSRLDIRQTGSDTKTFSDDKTIFHIDCEEAEINNRLSDCVPINADLNVFFDYLLKNKELLKLPSFEPWRQDINRLKEASPDVMELGEVEGINPNIFMHALSKAANEHVAGYLADVGAHQMWAAQSLELENNQFFMTSGGMGAMGFALPAAIGATLASKKQPVIVIIGDGSMQMNIQELQTIVRNKLPVKIVVINNQSLGMITQFQDSYFESRYQSTYWGYSAPDFVKIAQAYEIKAKRISSMDEISSGMQWMWQEPEEATLLEVRIMPHLHVYPKIAFGRPITEMEPFATPLAMEST